MFRSAALTSLALAVLAFPAAPASAEEMTKEMVQQIVRETISSNPEIIIEAFQNFQKTQKVQEQAKFKESLSQKAGDVFGGKSPSIGPKDATMTVVEFFDYNCGYCKRAVDDVIKLHEDDKKLRFVFKELPILSESSTEAARWALAANMQGKYFEFHKALMKNPGMKDAAFLEKTAKDLGLNVEKMKKDISSDEVKKELEDTQALARSLGITGTPAFIFEKDLLMPGYMGHDTMKSIIKEQRTTNEIMKQ